MPSTQDFTGPMKRARKKAKTAAANKRPVPPSPASVNRAERWQVDRQLQALEKQYFEARRQLRIRRNFAAPFSQMPAEVLSNIFLLVQGPFALKSSAELLEQRLESSCYREMLRRSRQASLRIVDPGNDSDTYQPTYGSHPLTPRARNLVACLEQHERVRELRLPSIPSSLLKHSVSRKLSLTYPTLEVLELGFSTQFINFMVIATHFLQNNMPYDGLWLKCVGFCDRVVRGVFFCPSNHGTIASAVEPSWRGSSEPSHSSNRHVNWTQMINLTSLRHLEVAAGLYTSTTIIQQCVFPPTTTYALHVERGDHVHPLSSLHSLLARVCATGVTKLVASEDYTDGGSNGILQIKVWSKACPALPVESFDSSRPVLSVSYPSSHIAATESWEAIFQRLLKQMKIHSLAELRTDVMLDPDDWLSLFGRLRYLTHVVLYNNAACHFLVAMQRSILSAMRRQISIQGNKMQRKQERAVPDFPVLRSLTLDTFDFSAWQLGQEDGSLLDSSYTLLDALQRRHQFGPRDVENLYRIQHLTLVHCHIDYEDEQVLRGCEDEVDVLSLENNEFERYFDDEMDSDDEDGSLLPFWVLANSLLQH
ncbi:hypothetical protein DL96DRAFT_1683191 [Flagelloscypha sp. PMI_526]|nr:hypothetical protein DL96DRAFT_1683191 [Flagelloscypha sp. PMI_526]